MQQRCLGEADRSKAAAGSFGLLLRTNLAKLLSLIRLMAADVEGRADEFQVDVAVSRPCRIAVEFEMLTFPAKKHKRPVGSKTTSQ